MQVNTNYGLQGNSLSGFLNRSNIINEELVRSKKLGETLISENTDSSLNSENIVNKRERNFFKKMFPDSSLQIENHILFNRNGKTVNANSFSKGLLIDAAV